MSLFRFGLACALFISLKTPATLRAQNQPASSTPAPTADTSALEGTWLGEVVAPNARTEIGFAFKRGGDGRLLTTFHMPAMFLYSAPLGPARVEGNTVQLRPLDTRLTLEKDQLVGTFGLSHLPITLRRSSAPFSPAAPPPNYPTAPTPAWSASLGAETWASPVVHGDLIVIGSADGRLHALDAATGKSRWTWKGEHPLYGDALVAHDRVYLLDERVGLLCLDAKTGELRWRTPLHDEQLGGGPAPKNPTFNRRTPTPVLLDGTLYIGSTDGGIYAVDPADGKVRWRHDARAKIFATASVRNGLLWFGAHDGSVFAFAPQPHKEHLRTKLPAAVVAPPVEAGDILLVGCRDYTLYGLRRSDLSVVWKYSFWFSWVESTPALVDGIAYVGGSDFARVTALEPQTGRSRWSTVVHGLTWGTPLVTDDTVYAGASAQRGAIIPHSGGLTALDRRTGTVKWRHIFSLNEKADRAGIIGSLALTPQHVIAVTFEGTVLAFPK